MHVYMLLVCMNSVKYNRTKASIQEFSFSGSNCVGSSKSLTLPLKNNCTGLVNSNKTDVVSSPPSYTSGFLFV